MSSERELVDRFVPRFFFGCEADDRSIAYAFSTANPFGARLQPVFSSDLAHWDVEEMNEVVAEAHGLVGKGVLEEQDFREFVFENPARLLLGQNPEHLRRHRRRGGHPASRRRRPSGPGAAGRAGRGGGLMAPSGVTFIKSGTVIDGTGRPGMVADVVLADGRIEAVGPDLAVPDGAEVVDCTGLVVAPGFIDPHTHYDAQILWDPEVTPSSWHGVTTVVVGNCGFGIAPTRPDDRPTILRVLENVEGMPLDALEAGIPWTFETFPEYLDAVEAQALGINVAVLLGHTPLRFFVMGDDATERAATSDEVARMEALVAEALEAGAVGFSTSRTESHLGAYGKPVPSRVCDLDEIRSLAGVLGRLDKGTLESTWGPDLFVDEFADIAREIQRPVSWAALMTNRRDPGHAPAVAAQVEAAGGYVRPQVACRPIVVQMALSDPFAFANVAAFGEILALEHEARPARYATQEWRTQGPRRRCRRPGATSSTSPWCPSPSPTRSWSSRAPSASWPRPGASTPST